MLSVIPADRAIGLRCGVLWLLIRASGCTTHGAVKAVLHGVGHNEWLGVSVHRSRGRPAVHGGPVWTHPGHGGSVWPPPGHVGPIRPRSMQSTQIRSGDTSCRGPHAYPTALVGLVALADAATPATHPSCVVIWGNISGRGEATRLATAGSLVFSKIILMGCL